LGQRPGRGLLTVLAHRQPRQVQVAGNGAVALAPLEALQDVGYRMHV
jgi:hypothetical protein